MQRELLRAVAPISTRPGDRYSVEDAWPRAGRPRYDFENTKQTPLRPFLDLTIGKVIREYNGCCENSALNFHSISSFPAFHGCTWRPVPDCRAPRLENSHRRR